MPSDKDTNTLEERLSAVMEKIDKITDKLEDYGELEVATSFSDAYDLQDKILEGTLGQDPDDKEKIEKLEGRVSNLEYKIEDYEERVEDGDTQGALEVAKDIYDEYGLTLEGTEDYVQGEDSAEIDKEPGHNEDEYNDDLDYSGDDDGGFDSWDGGGLG